MMRTMAVALVLAMTTSVGATEVKCLKSTGGAANRCLAKWTKTFEKCRGDAACEEAARAEGGVLEEIIAAIGAPKTTKKCDVPIIETLGYLAFDDLDVRLTNACRDWGEDAAAMLDADPAGDVKCLRALTAQLRKLRAGTIAQVGPKCAVKDTGGKVCDRAKRDAKLAKLAEKAAAKVDRKCGASFAGLGLGDLDDVIAVAGTNARHFAQMVYPPNDVGPTGELGPFPVGVRTAEFADPDRSNIAGDGPRPLTTEIYYPSTVEATAGVPRDIAQVLGVDVAATFAHRDVEPAEGTFPLIVFSHGDNGIRIQSVSYYLHLASHGYVVATPDHHGNTFLDVVPDPAVAINRPLDMQFLIDEMLRIGDDPGDPLFGQIDGDRIGASGHSFGGFTVFALAGTGPVPGTPPDPRVKAIVPIAPATAGFDAAFFASITVPTLILGGTIDGTTPFEVDQRPAFEQMSAGGAFVGLAEVIGGGHFTFSEFCEVPRELLAFLGGFEEACEPRHLPSRHARDRINYLGLNFFDATLRGDADALARLDPAIVNAFDDLILETK